MKNKKFLSLLMSVLMVFSMTGYVSAASLDEPAVTPSPDMGDSEHSCSYIDVDYEVPSLDGVNLPEEYAADSLPVAYSSVNAGIISSVKNQGSFGTCWSFAATACAETSLIRLGYPAHDLSELQLAYFTLKSSVADPLGLTAGDATTQVGKDFLNRGGNSIFTTWQLAKWSGLEDETAHSSLNYTNASVNHTIPAEYAYVGQAHMQNADIINMTDVNTVKQLIMNYGAAATSFFAGSGSSYRRFDSNTKCYAFYQNKYNTTNHAVTLVGWDDNYSKNNFATTPANNGAWLIKNSWGASSSNTGYIWVSYEDTSIKNNTAYFFQFEPSNNYAKNYQHDGSIGARTDYIKNGGKIANVFTAQTNESISAVAVGLNSVDVTYTVNVYTGLTDSGNPESGALVSTTTGYIPYAGYHTIRLSAPANVAKGQKFSVVFTLSTGSDDWVDYNVDKTYQNGDWIKFTANVGQGQSFYAYSSSSKWTDTYTENTPYNIRIKAFAADPVTAFVERLYSLVLGRAGDAAGVANWTNLLKTKTLNGSDVALGFFESDEFINKNVSNADFVNICYQTMLGRPADAAGTQTWVSLLESGLSRRYVLRGFIESVEFSTICNAAGINAGSVALVEPRDQNVGLTQFIARCYTKALARDFDPAGINTWCTVVFNGQFTPAAVAMDGFIHSDEFINRNLDNMEYVHVMYRTFLDREPDYDGLTLWVNALANGASRDDVMVGFAQSEEFKGILARYGLQ